MTVRSLTTPLGAPARVASGVAESVAGVAAFALLTALGGQVAIPLPFTPVPITLQTFFVLAAGVYLGACDGALSQVVYIGLGVAGLPLFAGGGAGPAHLIGPTAGFLLAFPVAAWIVGASLRPGHGLGRAALVLGAATAVIFAMGAAWLAQLLDVGFSRALTLAVIPFVPGGVFKAAALAALVTRGPVSR